MTVDLGDNPAPVKSFSRTATLRKGEARDEVLTAGGASVKRRPVSSSSQGNTAAASVVSLETKSTGCQ